MLAADIVSGGEQSASMMRPIGARNSFMESKARVLLNKLDAGKPVFGVTMLSPSPELVEILAYVGMDFVIVDQMFTPIDWHELRQMVRAARGSDLVVLGRVENNPWYGGDDLGVTARAARAMGVGCDGVKVHVYSATQAKAVMETAKDWHRNVHITPFAPDGFTGVASERAENVLVIPGVESKRGIEDTPEILQIDGLRIFAIAMTDTAIVLGHPMDYEHQDVWRFVDETVGEAKSKGIDICAGTGYMFRSWDEITGRVDRMLNHGIRMIFVQTPEFLLQLTMSDLVSRLTRIVNP